jgi:hypothetical protein
MYDDWRDYILFALIDAAVLIILLLAASHAHAAQPYFAPCARLDRPIDVRPGDGAEWLAADIEAAMVAAAEYAPSAIAGAVRSSRPSLRVPVVEGECRGLPGAVACAIRHESAATKRLTRAEIQVTDRIHHYSPRARAIILLHEICHILGLRHSAWLMSPDTLHMLRHPYLTPGDEARLVEWYAPAGDVP